MHAALALILTVGMWPIPVLRWIATAINTLMLVSIPIDGGHLSTFRPGSRSHCSRLWPPGALRRTQISHVRKSWQIGLVPGN
ncbi:MAG: hypothetical protein ACM3IH_13000 [Sphingobacteriales bacterium]